jgi:tRNA-specific 2-thiouridylase
MTRVVVGMSGGVDSSLTAWLVHERGDDVVGVTLKLWPCAEEDGGFTREDACCSPTETIDARAVARARGIPHYVIDMEQEFRAGVVDGFLAGYAAGETPNPCIRCNEKIKFGALWQHARALGAERVATGHYARVERVFDRWTLRTSVDTGKDQTYFLFSLTQEQLAAADFPVGAMTKDEVREAARVRRLVTADKHESQDICFVGSGGTAEFLRQEIPQAFRPGDIRHENGTLLGSHEGLAAFTIGQRKGLGVAWHEPLFVLRLDTATNTVVLGSRDSLLTDHLALREPTWHLGHPPAEEVLVRLRHRGTPLPARIAADGRSVRLLTPAPRPSTGQACVVYDPRMELCLGGAWIDRPTAP